MKYVLKNVPSPITSTIAYEKELNPEQFRVVSQADGPCLVLAGAGSGKTRTLIYRVAYLLERGVRPEEILLVTFTNKAAGQMRDRVEALLQTKAKGLWCGTFHHIGNRILRVYSKSIGLKEGFGILDDEDSRDLVKACIKSLGAGAGEARFPKAGVVQSVLSFAANSRQSVSAVIASQYAYLGSFVRDFERVRLLYEEKKKKTDNLDYDDLLIRWIELMQKAPEVRDRLLRQFRYVLVDEYQDTNRLQDELIGLISSHHKNLLVVGDDAQSIYSFRAAEIKNILDFPERHPGAKIFKLETNYRSTRPILDLANASIAHNAHQFPKKLRSARAEEENTANPQIVKVRDTRQGAAFVAQRILEFREDDISLDQIAVLFRARYQAAELELELAKRGIPYVIRGGVRFFEQAHIKDVLSYLRILTNPADELAWTRALTLQPGIGGTFAEKIFEAAQKEPVDLARVAQPSFGEHLPPRVREGLAGFKRVLERLLKEDRSNRPDLLIEDILENGYQKHVLLNFDNARDRLEDLKELVNFAHTYKSLKEFLADATLREGFKGESLVEDPDRVQEQSALVLSTIHQAKGLEWKAVFVIGLAEGLFPHAKSMEKENELEEERRLFYVSVTRAQNHLILVHAMSRYDYNTGTVLSRPSCFLAELPAGAADEVEVEESHEEETIYLDSQDEA